MANTLKFGNGQWYGKKDTILAYNNENKNYKPLPFSFDRASSATVINKEGLIETVGSGEPRIDFKDDSKGALLLEPSRTNKISTSNDFNGSGWLKTDLISTANQIISPDGTLNASKLEITGNGSLRNQSQAFFNNGYAYSIFVKKGNSRYVTIRSAFFTQSIVVGFDLDTLTAQTNGKIEDYGNDWYRLSITKDISGDADKSGFFYIYLPNSLGSQTSVSGNYTYFYGGQIEDGTYPTSYIPTQGTAQTRLADSCSNGGNEQVINSTEGVLYLECSAFANIPEGSGGYITISSPVVSFTNALILQHRSNGQLRVYFGGSGTSNIQFLVSNFDWISNNKIAVQYDSIGSNYKLFINGVSFSRYSLATNHSVVGLSELNFNYSNINFKGEVKDLRVYNTALTDQELASLTQV